MAEKIPTLLEMRNLLITTVGNDNLAHIWEGEGRNYDVITVDYRLHPTFKYPGIFKALRGLPKYDYYWMPDEDIYLTPRCINHMFETMAKYNLDLGQPSVEDSKRSFPSWPIFAHKPGPAVRYMPFIEVMCPCFSYAGLQKCLETFPKSTSGWGLDIVWAHLLQYQNMGLMNNIVVRHTRPPLKGSNLYKVLKDRPSAEMWGLIKEYNVIMLPYNAEKGKKDCGDGHAAAKRRMLEEGRRVRVRSNGRNIFDPKYVRESPGVDNRPPEDSRHPRRQLIGR